jgi:NitT/TauT family transport system substrate-binding protein
MAARHKHFAAAAGSDEEVLMRDRQGNYNRRGFVGGLTLAGTSALLGVRPHQTDAEPPPETTTLRLDKRDSLCAAPQYIAQELLRGEGFTDVRYVTMDGAHHAQKAVAAGELDISVSFVAPAIIQIDAGAPIVFLAGVHVGCFELFGTERVRAIKDLKGKATAIPAQGSTQHVFLSVIASHVGLDPQKDINWITRPRAEAIRLLAEGRVDAFLGFPPDPQELRAKKIGHVVMNSTVDRPWSQYFCCMFVANREFARKHPVATKRALRAILKSTDVCAVEPERVARFLVDKTFAPRHDYALQTLKDIPYDRWRQYDPEDAVRFYALRLHEAQMIKSSPTKIIAQGTNWRLLNELKKELKG